MSDKIEGTMTLDELLLIQSAVEKVTRERNELRAENERLKGAVTDLGVAHIQAQTEIGRLRAALQEILDHPAPSSVATVAREALVSHKE